MNPARPRYKALRRLHRSDMAEVLVASDLERGGAEVIVKRLLPELTLDKNLVALFERETAIARTLVHPNIVRILDAGSGFLVMEHLNGRDLRDAIRDLRRQGTRLTPARVTAVAVDAARALAFAHAAGVIHRDIKPANLFMTVEGPVKILDFGIATSADHIALTRTGRTRGTYAYMAPEQHAGMVLNDRADIFGLGVVLWEALTSRRLWKRDTPEEIVRAIRNEPAPPPSAHANGVPSKLEAMVMAMLAKLPASRPPASVIATLG